LTHIEFAAIVVKLFDGYEALGLKTGIDDHIVVIDANHLSGDDFARTHFLALKRLFEERGKTLGNSVQSGYPVKSTPNGRTL
jgi:hypothetical protein